MTIRPLRDDEHPTWWAMRRKLFADCDEEILTYEEERYDPAVGTEAVLVAEADGALVGFAEVAVRSRVDGASSDEVGYLEAWFVEADWRGKGVGRALVAAAEATRAAGLVLHMGHGLTYRNVSRVAAIPGICEFNIGHSIVSRAVLVGLERAVREMKALVE